MKKIVDILNKKNSRTLNTIYNFSASIGGQLLMLVTNFAVRTVFIKTLGKSYLGIGGLFSNILSMLSIAELGVGSAILFKLYEPIKEENHERITMLIRFYKDVYRWIGIIVAALGIALIPFLPKLINDYDKVSSLGINVAFIFLMYLFKTVCSYWFFAYKSAIIKANQKQYITIIANYIVTIVGSIVRIIVLYVYPNFEIYVLVSILEIIVHNIICARIADSMYPYINDTNVKKISSSEAKEIFKDCGSLFLYKVNAAVYKATDNIVLSKFVGLDAVAMYSNYYVFYTTINTVMNKVFNSVSHSLGNLHASKDRKHEYEIFEVVNLVTALLGGTAFVGIFVCANDFVIAWIGEEWLLAQPFAFLMGLEIYTLVMRCSMSKYRTIMGLFRQSKLRPIASMLINLIVSVLLVNRYGISGVILGTIVADWTTFIWYDPYIIHKTGFENLFPVKTYYFKELQYFIAVLAVGIFDFWIASNWLTGHGWITVVLEMILCIVTAIGVLMLISIRTQEGQYVLHNMKKYLNKITRKFKKHK